MTRKSGGDLPLVDALKAIASQLIVWHHLAFYGPMSDVVSPHAPALFEWLADEARLAVACFLALGGFLAARSLAPRIDAGAPALAVPDVPKLMWKRYVRLARPCGVALALALAAAAIARRLIDEPSVPAEPGFAWLLAHVFFVQDVLGLGALSAGLWYVAIDFQLYAMLVLALAAARPLAHRLRLDPRSMLFALVASATAGSLLWANRQPELDAWAPYFFGAYGLGILAQWVQGMPGRAGRLALLAFGGALALAALGIEMRSRIAVAAVTALVLALETDAIPLRHAGRAACAWLNGFGLVATWLASLAAGHLLHQRVEARAAPRRAAPVRTGGARYA